MKKLALVASLLSVALVPLSALAQDAKTTPTDVFYLAKSIDDSIKKAEKVKADYSKERISNNIKPRNVYEKATALAEMYNALHPNSVDAATIQGFREKDPSSTKPKDVYGVLSTLKAALETAGHYHAYAGPKSTKTPSDVFQQLRQVSNTMIAAATSKGVDMPWGRPDMVFESSIYYLLPHVYNVADKEQVDYGKYHFPEKPLPGIKPRHVFKLQQQFFDNMNTYMKKQDPSYEAIKIEKIKDLNALTPDDVLSLAQIISGELKAVNGNQQLPADVETKYQAWKSKKSKIAPGDVSQLVKHMFMVSKQLNSKKA